MFRVPAVKLDSGCRFAVLFWRIKWCLHLWNMMWIGEENWKNRIVVWDVFFLVWVGGLPYLTLKKIRKFSTYHYQSRNYCQKNLFWCFFFWIKTIFIFFFKMGGGSLSETEMSSHWIHKRYIAFWKVAADFGVLCVLCFFFGDILGKHP